MDDRKLLRTGIVGSVIAAICCFTPALVILMGAVGLSALVGWWLDYFLLYPALAFFLALSGYAIYRIKRAPVAERVAAEAKVEAEE